MISYAQNAEDVVLRRVFADRSTPGFYIDIGARHPFDDSVTHYFYANGWRGLNVETDPIRFEHFLQARPNDENVRTEIGSKSGDASRASRGREAGANQPIGRKDADVVLQVSTKTLSDLIDDHVPSGTHIDFLKIDVAGSEDIVVKSLDWTRRRPTVVLVRSVDLTDAVAHREWDHHLAANGYRFALFDGLNRFYCREEDAGSLAPRLASPANATDRFVRRSEADAIRRVRELTEARGEIEDSRGSVREEIEEPDASALRSADGRIRELETRVRVLEVDLSRAHDAAARALRREEHVESLLAEEETRRQAQTEVGWRGPDRARGLLRWWHSR